MFLEHSRFYETSYTHFSKFCSFVDLVLNDGISEQGLSDYFGDPNLPNLQ